MSGLSRKKRCAYTKGTAYKPSFHSLPLEAKGMSHSFGNWSVIINLRWHMNFPFILNRVMKRWREVNLVTWGLSVWTLDCLHVEVATKSVIPEYRALYPSIPCLGSLPYCFRAFNVSGSACQGWAADWAPTDLPNCPTNDSVVSTPLKRKLLSIAYPSGRLYKN